MIALEVTEGSGNKAFGNFSTKKPEVARESNDPHNFIKGKNFFPNRSPVFCSLQIIECCYIYIYLNLHSYLSEFHFFERRIPYSKKSSFNPKVKYFISDSNIQLLLEWNWNSEAEHFISNQSNLAISEWVFCFLYLNLQKMRQLSKIFYYWQSFIFFFFLEIGFIRTPHSYQGLFAGSWEKLIPIASLYVWNLWVIWMQQKIIWELSLNRHRGSSVSLNTANLHLMGCVTATQPFPIETFFA